METILGIDLGTTNSAVSIIEDGKASMVKDEHGESILPSIVGVDSQGRLLVGREARNQAIVAPERTVKSIKRKMGEDVQVSMGEKSYTPQEVSAMILRTLKRRAEAAVGGELKKAVITVPAFFTENQREATREAGELAGLEVVRIINEPTAASLTYEAKAAGQQRLLVYDLGGGTFDVSIVELEEDVVEVLASHGDTHLGGDDFDQLLLDFVCEKFKDEQGLDLREIPTANSRLIEAVEAAKCRLSFEPFTNIEEEFIAEKDGRPLNLTMELARSEYEQLIQPLLDKTIKCVDDALDDAKLQARQIDKIILVGGSSRTPRVHEMLQEQLGQQPHQEVDPDLCVAMGAAVQGGLIAGLELGPVLVDITPHTLGIQVVGDMHGVWTDNVFAPIIARNTPLPAARSEVFYTCADGQEKVHIHVLQGEHKDIRLNDSVGEFYLEGLDEEARSGSEILVRFELNLDGILNTTAVERATGLEESVAIDNTITRFRADGREEAQSKLAEMFGDATAQAEAADDVPEELREQVEQAQGLVAKAQGLAKDAPQEDAEEMGEMAEQLQLAVGRRDGDAMREIGQQLEDLLFYLQDA